MSSGTTVLQRESFLLTFAASAATAPSAPALFGGVGFSRKLRRRLEGEEGRRSNLHEHEHVPVPAADTTVTGSAISTLTNPLLLGNWLACATRRRRRREVEVNNHLPVHAVSGNEEVVMVKVAKRNVD